MQKGANKEVLGRSDVIKYLENFHSKFVITSIDKTTSNKALIKFLIKNAYLAIYSNSANWVGNYHEGTCAMMPILLKL